MAIVIPSKSLYSPIENEKVRTTIGAVSIAEIDTDSKNIKFSKRIGTSGSSGNEENVLMPISEYFSSTLKPVDNISVRLEYHIANEGDEHYEVFYKTFKTKLKFNIKKRDEVVFTLDETSYGIYVQYIIYADENGVSYGVYFQTYKVANSSSDYQDDIHLDTIQLSFSVSAVKRAGTEVKKKYGENSKNELSVASNELMQSTAMVDMGFNGIRYLGIEESKFIDYDIVNGYKYYYKTFVGNEVDSLYPKDDEEYSYLGYYFQKEDYSDNGFSTIYINNFETNTGIGGINKQFLKNVHFYRGIDYEEIPCTYSWGTDILSVYVNEDITSTAFKIVLDFGETGWLQKEKLSSVIAKGILREYKNGKETAKIRCSTNDYYDESDNLAISPKGQNDLPMLFSVNDEVIPMITADRAMSYKDGTPKVFRVVSTRFENRGALWQELTLQEK